MHKPTTETTNVFRAGTNTETAATVRNSHFIIIVAIIIHIYSYTKTPSSKHKSYKNKKNRPIHKIFKRLKTPQIMIIRLNT